MLYEVITLREADILTPITAAVSLVGLNYKHSGVDINLDLPAAPVLVTANPQWIQQVVVNLVENSFDAILAKGKSHISETIKVTGKVVEEEGRSQFMLEILDNGIGIPAENLVKVRDAFFTTKQETKGTGLGLSIGITSYNVCYTKLLRVARAVFAIGESDNIESTVTAATTAENVGPVVVHTDRSGWIIVVIRSITL